MILLPLPHQVPTTIPLAPVFLSADVAAVLITEDTIDLMGITMADHTATNAAAALADVVVEAGVVSAASGGGLIPEPVPATST